MATIARSPAQVVAGEAVSGTPEQRWNDMLNIASVMVNRAAMLGVSVEDVVGTTKQFNAYNKPLPAGTQSLTDMAQQALDQVTTTGPVNDATFYATPAAVKNLPGGLTPETETTGHQFFSDPKMRAIETAVGMMKPNPESLPSLVTRDPLQQALAGPYTANGLTNGITSLTEAPAQAVTSESLPAGNIDPAFAPNGLLSGAMPVSSFNPVSPTATADNYAGLGLAANAVTPGILGNVPASADLGASLGLDASTSVPGMISNATVSDRMGVPSTSFRDMAAAGPISAPMDVTGILGDMKQPQLAADASVPMSASIFSPAYANPVANNFGDLAAAGPISTPASVNSVEASAQPTGINSPDQAAMDSSVNAQLAGMSQTPTENSFANLAAAGPISAPVNAQPSGILGMTPGLTATASATPTDNTGLLSGYQATPTSTPAEAAIGGILSAPSISQNAIDGYQQMAQQGVIGGITNLSGNTLVGPTGVATTNVPTTVDTPDLATVPSTTLGTQPFNVAQDPAVSMPSLQTVSVPEQPTVAGPVDTPAVSQQPTQVRGALQSPSPSGAVAGRQGLLGGMLNKGTLTGGILGSMALGPVGGILGGLLGNHVNQSGGLLGGLGDNGGLSISNIGGGMANVASVYGGAPPGTQANTNNGGTVTALGFGKTAYTNPMGVTSVFGPNGQNTAYNGPSLTGGLSPGNDPNSVGGTGGSSPGMF